MKAHRILLNCLQLVGATAVLTDEEHAGSLIAWLKNEKGYFSDKLELRRENPDDPGSRFGMYSKRDFKEGELMIRVPQSMILHSEEEVEHTVMDCSTVRFLANEIRLKDKSKYAPYINYLLDTQPPGQLPSAWSEPGKELLLRALGDSEEEWPRFPPFDPVDWIDDDWRVECEGSEDPIDEYAALLVVQRSWDDVLIPVFDMMSHRNGHWLNTDSNTVHGDEPIQVVALRDIRAGEEIYTSYNMCRNCGNRMKIYGTPDIFRDYGFIEQFPQSWIFQDLNLSYRIDEVYDEDGDGTGDHWLSEWIGEEPDDNDIDLMKEKLIDLQEIKELNLIIRDPNVPEHEWNMINDFINAMEFAITIVTETYTDDEDDYDEEEDDETCADKETCTTTLNNYANLDKAPPVYPHKDYEQYNGFTCDINSQFEIFNDGTMVEIESIQSAYQEITFSRNPDTKNGCMDLDETLQICDSYRPHYHEYAVHNTARFLSDIKRVLFVGGGDSMILHEVLKYPGLELVVGLELDQRVVRGSFKHFGAQPHFHDERVEWWFGDASKSLMMLPKEYYASFDMVLVDLSETTTSFKVTYNIDVLEALSLLLKPEGIFVKNDVYIETFKTMFPYSTQIIWYDNPMVCSQVMVLGSRSVDFMNTDLVHHDVSLHVVRDLDKIDDNFDLIHDYNKNASSVDPCHLLNNGDKEYFTKQTSSPGIIMIVEAEHAHLANSDNLKGILTSALEKVGLTVVSTSTTTNDDGNTQVTIILHEGYVIARLMPEHKYCGFDIHFWSSFEKHESAKDTLISAVGSKGSTSSAFRVIAGGMLGTPSWEQDEKIRGPQQEYICNIFESASSKGGSNDVNGIKENQKESFIDATIRESIKLLQGKNQKVGVLCGSACPSVAKLESIDSVAEVVTLNCPTMTDFNEFDEDASDDLAACEKHLTNILMDASESGRLDTIVIDSTADKIIGSILLKMPKDMLNSQAKIISTFADESEKWRIHLLKRFKNQVFYSKPHVFYSEVVFSSDEGSFKLLVTSSGEEHFIKNLKDKQVAYEEGTGMTPTVQNINGGLWSYQNSFAPSKSFSPDDYDQSSPLEQWNSQLPLGHQVVFQMVSKEGMEDTVVLSNSLIREALEVAMLKSSLPLFEEEDVKSIDEYNGAGDGCVFTSIWSGGSIAVLWNGGQDVDINIFVYKGDNVIHSINAFEKHFKRIITSLTTKIRDEQPRGVGRVVSYWTDIEGGTEPQWA